MTMPPREFDEESANQETHLLGTSKRRDRIIEGIEEPALSSSEILSRSRNLLYLSHFFNQFSESFWQFCVILFLAAFSNYESLVLICSYGLVSASFVCFFGSAAGRFVDGTNRLVVARRLIGFENCAVLLATLCCYLLLSKSNYSSEYVTKYEGVPVDPWSLFLLFWIHILGAGAKVLDTGFLVAVERDWIVVMSKCAEDQTKQTDQLAFKKAWLSDTNVAMKQIDLSCKVVAPAVAGFFVAAFPSGHSNDNGANLIGAAILVGAINVSALFVEYACTAQIYANIPSLAFKRVTSGLDRKPLHTDEARQGHIVGPRKQLCLFTNPEALKVYLTQDISYAGIGLSMLYLNVLSFGGVMTAYLVWKGMRLEAIGVWRGVSSAIGLLGTFAYHFMSRRMTLIDTGMSSVTFQFLCLSLSYASLYVEDFTMSLAMLIAGVCASRIGLWVFDISTTQLFQLHVDEEVRGLVGGVQQSLNALFGMFSFVLGILIPDPAYFHYYVSVGYVSVGLSVLCYAAGVYSRRDKLSLPRGS